MKRHLIGVRYRKRMLLIKGDNSSTSIPRRRPPSLRNKLPVGNKVPNHPLRRQDHDTPVRLCPSGTEEVLRYFPKLKYLITFVFLCYNVYFCHIDEILKS